MLASGKCALDQVPNHHEMIAGKGWLIPWDQYVIGKPEYVAHMAVKVANGLEVPEVLGAEHIGTMLSD